MLVTRLRLRDFRTHAAADVALGAGLTVVHGPNGAGKTNLLEGIYCGCTGRSCRTRNDRELVRFGADAARVELSAQDDDGSLEIGVGIAPGAERRIRVDGAPVERLLDVTRRPLAGVFLPERLELIKGQPAVRRAHLDGVLAALWPSRRESRLAYARALAQRNALVARIRKGAAQPASLDAWDVELARHGVELIADRERAVRALAEPFASAAADLGLDGDPGVAYRPRSRATTAAELVAELAERRGADLERGFTTHGPHRDELALSRAGRELRVYGSQGQQRLALLALLLAEREVVGAVRAAPPLMLLDDVMSELDPERRERLVARLREAGQSVITTTDLDHVPGAEDSSVARIAVADGSVVDQVAA